MPWTFDCLLPIAERYASLRFRRVSYRFDPTRLDYGEAVELCAVARTLGLKTIAPIFHWSGAGKREMTRLLEHLDGDEDVALAVSQNREAYSRDEGLRVLEVMREHGWSRGPVPEIVRYALLDMRDDGVSQPKIAAQLGLTLDQVRVMANGLRPRRRAVRLADAALWAQ